MEIIFMDTFSIVPSGHDADHAGAASGTGLDIQVIRADKLDLMARLLTFLQNLFQHNIRIGHLSAE
jgi:hypothetical protein